VELNWLLTSVREFTTHHVHSLLVEPCQHDSLQAQDSKMFKILEAEEVLLPTHCFLFDDHRSEQVNGRMLDNGDDRHQHH